jgi:hypothetical protein
MAIVVRRRSGNFMNQSETLVEQTSLEATLKELARLNEKFPSRHLYEQMAECYRLLNEPEEADVMIDLAKHAPSTRSGLLV